MAAKTPAEAFLRQALFAPAARAVQVIIDVLEGDDVPLRLLLGLGAVNLARTKLRVMSKNIERWVGVSSSTEYPAAL